MPSYASYVKFTAQPGKRDALVQQLLEAARAVESVAGCQIYVVNTSPDEADVVWVTEIWDSQADAQAVLTTGDAQASIQAVLALLAHSPEQITLQPVGGKGIA